MNDEDQEAAEWAQYENESRRFREDCDDFSRKYQEFLDRLRKQEL